MRSTSSSSPRPMAMATSRLRPRASSRSLRRWTRRPARTLAVLGFGDSSFPAFCGYAREGLAACRAQGLARASGLRHGRPPVGAGLRALGQRPRHRARPAARTPCTSRCRRPTSSLTLVSRRDYGAEVQAPSAILRFACRASPVAAPDGCRLRALRGGRPAGRGAAGLGRAALLFAGLRRGGRLRRDRGAPSAGRLVLGPAHRARARRQRRGLPQVQPGLPRRARARRR